MKMDIQKLRNLTTGKLHTNMDDVYGYIEMIIGEESIMTHMLPNLLKAITPWLEEKIDDPAFWNGEYDPSHIGTIEIENPTVAEQDEMLNRYKPLPFESL